MRWVVEVSIPLSGFWPVKPGHDLFPWQGTRQFQSPCRDSGRSNPTRAASVSGGTCVSIPLSGFWPVKLTKTRTLQFSPYEFQSPCRDSGRSNPGIHDVQAGPLGQVSIPLSGFWPVKRAALGRLGQPLGRVSIPLSGFWPVKHYRPRGGHRRCRCFNPPVGILAGQTGRRMIAVTGRAQFQSPCRDSGRSNLAGGSELALQLGNVSIPLSGFWPVKPPSWSDLGTGRRCFNPPVGILAGQTGAFSYLVGVQRLFQSPCRDSGRSNFWPYES